MAYKLPHKKLIAHQAARLRGHIAAASARGDKVSLKELREAFGISPSELTEALEVLLGQGEIEKNDD